jgi:hypothetical protein
MNPRRVAAVVGKETKEVVRDPITLWIALLMPLVMLFIFGYAISLDVEDMALGILDQDRTPARPARARPRTWPSTRRPRPRSSALTGRSRRTARWG